LAQGCGRGQTTVAICPETAGGAAVSFALCKHFVNIVMSRAPLKGRVCSSPVAPAFQKCARSSFSNIRAGGFRNMSKSTERFSSRAENYAKYRPSYPREILTHLQDNCRLTSKSTVADIGSGTGFLTELFLQNGNIVYGVEPNQAMRQGGERFLSRLAQFVSWFGRRNDVAGCQLRFCRGGAGFSLV
jgi:hypothetical protein